MKRFAGLLMFVAGLLLVVVGAGTAGAQSAEDNAAEVAAGQAVFEMSCAGCHGEDGTGVSGLGRPLIGIAEQGDRARHIATITDGRGGMPGFGERLSTEEISAAASYVRLTFVEAAAETTDESPAELAVTGAETPVLALVGTVLVLGGLQLVVFSRRRS